MPHDDVVALADRLRELIIDDTFRTRMGARARTFEVEVDNLGRRFEARPSGN